MITNAGTAGGDVKALVYVDAFIPEVGETVFQILGGPGSAFDLPDPSAVFDIAGSTITEVGGSHVSMVSHPQTAIDAILAAVAAIG